MTMQPLARSLLLLAALFLPAGRALAMGEILGETREQLKLKYEVKVQDPDNGQVQVEFTLEDEGRMKPLDAVELAIPKQDGSGTYDLTANLSVREDQGKRVARFNLKKEWAARAEIWLNTYHFDGKPLVMTHYHYLIPVAQYLKKPDLKKQEPAKPAAAPRKRAAAKK